MNRKAILYIVILIISTVSVFVSQYFSFFIPALFAFILLFVWVVLFTQVFSFANEKPVQVKEIEPVPVSAGSVLELFDPNPFLQFFRKLSLETDKIKYSQDLFHFLAREIDISQGVFYLKESNTIRFHCAGLYAFFSENTLGPFLAGEGLHGQVVVDKKIIFIEGLSDRVIVSGLGKIKPSVISIIPLLDKNDDVWAVLELAFINNLSVLQKDAVSYIMQNLVYLNAEQHIPVS